MKPNDLIQVTYPNGAQHVWRVTAVLLGALDVENVVQLEPVGLKPNGHGPTLCPHAMLDALCEGGSVVVYQSPALEHR